MDLLELMKKADFALLVVALGSVIPREFVPPTGVAIPLIIGSIFSDFASPER